MKLLEYQSESYNITVSVAAKLSPTPQLRVLSRKQNKFESLVQNLSIFFCRVIPATPHQLE